MIYKICYVIAQVLLYFAILEWITYRTVQKNKYCRRICCGTLMLLEGILTTITDNISNGGEVAFIFLCILGLFTYLCLTDSKNNLLYNFSMVISAVTIEVIYLIILTIPCSYLCLWLSGENNIFLVREIFTIADLEVSFCIFFFGKKIPLYKLFEIKGIRIISTVVGIISIVLQQVGLQLVKSNRGKVNILIANFLIFTIIIGILWLLDHYRLAAGKLKVEQDNRRMNTSLHKTKELMPLLISVVNENEGLLDPQLVEEFNQIYSEQMIAGRKDSMNYKLLGTTGIKLLDAQLQHYILECNKKGIVMDVFASEPIAKQIHEMGIAQLMVHNVVGDLLRNAIRAITRDGRTDGKILVIVGKKNETVEIDIFDNGANLPLEVLERFGTRGVTTGGTGNGLADLVEMLAAENISLVIRENAGENSTYTKGFLLVFGGKNRRELITWRADEPALRQNDYWDIKELTE